MSSRRSTPVRLLAALAAFLVLAVGAGTAGSAQDAAPDASGDSALLDLVGCLQGSGRLAVVFLFDESGSLQFTDVEGRRVDAALTALDSLAVLAGGGDAEQLAVDVTLGTFSDNFRQEGDWTALDPENLPAIRRSMESLRTRNDGKETDFLTALDGTRDALAARTAEITVEGGEAPCKAVLFFTDGAEYKLTQRTAENQDLLDAAKRYAPGVNLATAEGIATAERAGRAEMCREGGLADQVRADDISMITVSLFAGEQVGDADFLPAISTGSSGDLTCGKPSDTATGTYLVADDVDTLITSFDEIATRLAGGTLVPFDGDAPTLCTEPCPASSRTVDVDPTVRRIRALALAPEPGMRVTLDGPAGSIEIDEAGAITVGSVDGRVAEVAGRGYSVSLDRPEDDADWSGEWTISAVHPSEDLTGEPAVLQVYVFSDIGVDLAPGLALTRGEASQIEASVVPPAGVDPAEMFSEAPTVTARLDDPITKESWTVELSGPPEGPYTGDFTVPAEVRSNAFEVSVELDGTTREGAAVVARSISAEVLVRRPGGAVQIAPASLVMPTLTGSGSTSTDLLLIGGETAGCVWFGPVNADGPDEAGAIKVSYDGRDAVGETSCIEVPAGETVTVSVEVDPAHRATGAVRGMIEVHEKVEGGTASVTDVAFGVDLARGIDQARRLVAASVLIVVGLALPMFLLFAINALGARFQDLDVVQAAVLPVRVQGTRLERTDGRRLPLSFHTSDFTSLSGRGDTKSFTFGGVEFRAKASSNPFGATEALAAPEGGAEKLKGGAGRKVELDPSLAGSWVFLLDPDRTRRAGDDVAEGNLIAFLAEGPVMPQVERMMPDLRLRLPDTASSLAELVRGKKAKAAKARQPDET